MALGVGCTGIVILQAHDHEVSMRREHWNNLNHAYQAAIDTYRLSSQLVFDEAINRTEVLELMAQAARGSLAEQNQARQVLLDRLQPTYDNLQTYNLRQLHFHLPDNTSFLRFHRPEKFGDSLVAVRPSVVSTNQTKQPVVAFEEGRIFNGFRYVFPLFISRSKVDTASRIQNQSIDLNQDFKHVGSVEISVSFTAIQEMMEKFSPSSFDFLIASSIVQDKVFQDEQSNYQKNQYYPLFFQESHQIQNSATADINVIPRETLNQLADRIGDRVAPRMAQYEAFSIIERFKSKGYLIGFLPVKNFQNEPVGYIISYLEKPEIILYHRTTWLQVGCILIVVGLLWAFVEMDRRRAALSRRQHELQSMNQQLEREVQQRIQTEQRLLNMNQDLEQEVQARARAESLLHDRAQELERVLADLQSTHLQLVQSEKMSSLGQLVAGVAHEINNSTNFIHGNLALLEEAIADVLSVVDIARSEQGKAAVDVQADEVDLNFLREDIPAMLQSMQTGADRTREIVRSLRTFSRLDESERKDINLHEGINSTLVILGHRLKAKGDRPGIGIIRHYDPNLPVVPCYPGPLNQVIMNLLGNAIDAIEERWTHQHQTGQPPTPGHLTLTTQVQADPRCVQLLIGDDGVGMTAEVQQQMFDQLFTTKSASKGTGLGLAIAHDIIVHQHGGTLHAESTPGIGTTFVVSLPLVPAS